MRHVGQMEHRHRQPRLIRHPRMLPQLNPALHQRSLRLLVRLLLPNHTPTCCPLLRRRWQAPVRHHLNQDLSRPAASHPHPRLAKDTNSLLKRQLLLLPRLRCPSLARWLFLPPRRLSHHSNGAHIRHPWRRHHLTVLQSLLL